MIDELRSKCRAAGILLVDVEPTEEEGGFARAVKGTLDDYLAAVIALRAPVVFAETTSLDEEEFRYSEDDDDAEAVDLCEIEPRLKKFRQYVSNIGSVTLTAPIPMGLLTYVLQQEWYKEFLDCWESAVDEIENKRQATLADQESKEESERRPLLGRLRALIDDPGFAKLPTQKAMLQFALRKIPGLDRLDRSLVRTEIQDLVAILDARHAEQPGD